MALSLIVSLARIYIENRHYENVIERFDRPETFFYLDPPYYGCENYYGDGFFSREDYAKLSSALATLKGKFILSINNHQEIRETFKGFRMAKVKTRYTTAHAKHKGVTELLISNF